MIPCLGFLTYLNPNYGARLLNSIDYPIKTLVIINNSSYSHQVWINAVKNNPYIKEVFVHTQENSGVAPGWNKIIKSTPDKDYWIFVNDDINLVNGELEKFNTLFKTSDEKTAMAGIANAHFAILGIKKSAIKKVGLFDENFYPAYYEDLDMLARLKCAKLQHVFFEGFTSSHDGSESSDQTSQKYFNFAYRLKTEILLPYYIDKWGGEWPKITKDAVGCPPIDLVMRSKILKLKKIILGE